MEPTSRDPAESYERKVVPVVFGPWSQVLLDAAGLADGERVLDVACGTGIVARNAARRARLAAVAGVDSSAAMLAVARRVSAEEGLAIEWLEGLAEALPAEDRAYDLVLCQHGAQFVEDPAAALGEMRRVLRPGGRVAVATWCGLERHPFLRAMAAEIERALGVPAFARPFTLGDEGVVRSLLADAGFGDVRVVERSRYTVFGNPGAYVRMQVEVLAAAVPAAQHLDEAARAELVATIGAAMDPHLRAHERDGELAFDMHALLAQGVRPRGA